MGKYLALLGFVATVPVANWMIGNIGTCIPNGPCLVPVGFGLSAPSGVLMVGLSLVLRDIVHEKLGSLWAIAAIMIGAVLSAYVAPPALVIASASAFLLSELADMAVYSPLREKKFYTAVVLSGLVGSIVDSAVFLIIAFGSLQFIEGQILGKMWMTIAAVGALMAIRASRKGKLA